MAEHRSARSEPGGALRRVSARSRRPAARQPAADLLLPNGERLSLPAFRALFEAHTIPDDERSLVADESIAGRTGPIRIRRHLPAHTPRPHSPQPAIIYFHGGGWVAGSLDSHDALCRHLASMSGLQVIAIDYRLAPEHPFPAAVEDATDAFALVQHRADRWGLSPSRLIVMGEGAGATLAAVAAIHARDMCLPLPVAQVLLHPLIDLGDAEGQRALPDLADWFRGHYLRSGGDPRDWRVSPLRASSLSGLPTAFIAIAGRDRFGQDAQAFADRLRAAGIATELHRRSEPLKGNPALDGDGLDAIHAAIRFVKTRVVAA